MFTATPVTKHILCLDLGRLPLTPSGAILPWEAAAHCDVSPLQADGSLTLRDTAGRTLFAITTFTPGTHEGFRLSIALKPGERVFGLGEDNDAAFGRLDRRGTVRDFLTGQRINQNHVTADFPIPFFLVTGGETPYALYLDNTSNLSADIGKTDPDALIITAPAGGCRLYVIAGDTPAELVQRWTGLTGRSALPPLWVLGYMQSKCAFWDWEEIDDVIETFREQNVPLDSIVFDFNWARTFNDFHWADRWQGLSAEKMHHYREKYGIRFMASNSGPMLKSDSCTHPAAQEAGIIAKDAQGKPVVCGYYSGELIDYTNPAAAAWLKPQLDRIMEDGVEAWWLDLTEPEGDSETTQYHAGSRANIHNIFSNAVTAAFQNVMEQHSPGKRPFVLTRTGTAGIQRRPTALWTGDIYSEYGTLQAHVPEALNTQLSGVGMWTCDTGGFLSPTNNDACPHNLYHNDRAEHAHLYERWMQFSTFTPILRTHHAGGESVPFRYPDIAVDGMAHYIRLRYRLIPYIYSLYHEQYRTGAPLMRPLFWHHPADDRACAVSDEYLFGRDLLVAPVLTENTNRREVYFPQGSWYDLDYGYLYEGPCTAEVYAPHNRIPVFARGGALIPMAKNALSTRDLDLRDLDLHVWPEGSDTFTLFADDGETTAYQQGVMTATAITCDASADRLHLTLRADNDLFAPRTVTMHIHMKNAPANILVNGAAARMVGREMTVRRAEDSAAWFDAFTHVLHVKCPLTGLVGEVTVTLDPGTAFPPLLPFSEANLVGQLPYIYPPAEAPCVIDAIHYDRGGEGVAFHRLTKDTANLYRDDNAGIAEDDQGLYIADLRAGEWLEYSISCGKEGLYDIILEGSTDGADLVAEAGGCVTAITSGCARVTLGTGSMVLHIGNHAGTANLRKVHIRRV